MTSPSSRYVTSVPCAQVLGPPLGEVLFWSPALCAYTCALIHMLTCGHLHVCTYSARTCTCVYLHVCMYTHALIMFAPTCVHLECLYLHVCTDTYAPTGVHLHTGTYTRAWVCPGPSTTGITLLTHHFAPALGLRVCNVLIQSQMDFWSCAYGGDTVDMLDRWTFTQIGQPFPLYNRSFS